MEKSGERKSHVELRSEACAAVEALVRELAGLRDAAKVSEKSLAESVVSGDRAREALRDVQERLRVVQSELSCAHHDLTESKGLCEELERKLAAEVFSAGPPYP